MRISAIERESVLAARRRRAGFAHASLGGLSDRLCNRLICAGGVARRQLCLAIAGWLLSLGHAYADESGAGRAVVTMEGVTYELAPVDATNSTVTLDEKGLLFYVTAADQPVSVNFNLFDMDALAQVPVVFKLPDDNTPRIRVELSFFNTARKSGRLQRRITFSEGTITVLQADDKTLTLQFEGSGHPMMDALTFPIEGAIDIRLP